MTDYNFFIYYLKEKTFTENEAYSSCDIKQLLDKNYRQFESFHKRSQKFIQSYVNKDYVLIVSKKNKRRYTSTTLNEAKREIKALYAIEVI